MVDHRSAIHHLVGRRSGELDVCPGCGRPLIKSPRRTAQTRRVALEDTLPTPIANPLTVSPLQALSTMDSPTPANVSRDDRGCRIFAIKQFECSPEGGRITCWPLDRIFRQ